MIHNFELYDHKGRFLGVQPVSEEGLWNFITADWGRLTYKFLCTTDENLTEEEVWDDVV